MKQQPLTQRAGRRHVAPHAGAWIETVSNRIALPSLMSPPTRGRGLKPPIIRPLYPRPVSPPTRGRGLKPWQPPPRR